MLDLLKLVLEIAVVAAAGAIIFNWDKIAATVSNWLQKNNLSKSKIMDILIVFDRYMSGLRRILKVKTTDYQEHTLEEKTISLEDLKKEDYALYQDLQRRGFAQKNVTDEVLCHVN